MPSELCRAVKANGDPCQFKARESYLTCWRHRGQETKLQGDDKKVTPLPKSPKKGEEE